MICLFIPSYKHFLKCKIFILYVFFVSQSQAKRRGSWFITLCSCLVMFLFVYIIVGYFRNPAEIIAGVWFVRVSQQFKSSLLWNPELDKYNTVNGGQVLCLEECFSDMKPFYLFILTGCIKHHLSGTGDDVTFSIVALKPVLSSGGGCSRNTRIKVWLIQGRSWKRGCPKPRCRAVWLDGFRKFFWVFATSFDRNICGCLRSYSQWKCKDSLGRGREVWREFENVEAVFK